MRNLLYIVISLLLLAGNYSTAVAQEERKCQLWMSEGRGCLEGRFGNEHRDEAIKWFRRVKRLYYFNKMIRGQAMRGIADYQLYKGDTAAAIKTLRKVIGKRIAHKIEKGDAGTIRKRKKEEWNRYYAASALLDLHLMQHTIDKAQRYAYYIDKKVSVNWYCGDGSFSNSSMITNAYVVIHLQQNNPDSAFFYWNDGWFAMRSELNKYGKRLEKNDSLIFSALLRKYGADTLKYKLQQFTDTIYWRDTLSASGMHGRLYYSDFSGMKIMIDYVYSNSEKVPMTATQHKETMEWLESLMKEYWMLKTLLKTGS